jgi:hypothetical protein
MRAMHRGRSRGNPGSETRRECTMQQDSRRGEFACGLGERPRCGTLFKFAQVGVPSAKNLQCFRPDRLRGATSCSHYLSSPGAAITGFHFPFLLRTRECPKCRRVTENVTVPGRSATDSFCSLRPRELQMSR